MSDDIKLGKVEFDGMPWRPGRAPQGSAGDILSPEEFALSGTVSRVAALERERDGLEAHVDRLAGELASAHEDLVLARGREAKLREGLAPFRSCADIPENFLDHHGFVVATEGPLDSLRVWSLTYGDLRRAAALLAEPVPGEPPSSMTRDWLLRAAGAEDSSPSFSVGGLAVDAGLPVAVPPAAPEPEGAWMAAADESFSASPAIGHQYGPTKPVTLDHYWTDPSGNRKRRYVAEFYKQQDDAGLAWRYAQFVEHAIREGANAVAFRERAESAERLLARLEELLQADRLDGPRDEALLLAAETWPKRLDNEVDLSASLRKSLEAAEREVCSLQTQLGAAEEEIADLREQIAAKVHPRVAELEAVLGVAGKALDTIVVELDELGDYAPEMVVSSIEALAQQALFAPALARAIELDRARREELDSRGFLLTQAVDMIRGAGSLDGRERWCAEVEARLRAWESGEPVRTGEEARKRADPEDAFREVGRLQSQLAEADAALRAAGALLKCAEPLVDHQEARDGHDRLLVLREIKAFLGLPALRRALEGAGEHDG